MTSQNKKRILTAVLALSLTLVPITVTAETNPNAAHSIELAPFSSHNTDSNAQFAPQIVRNDDGTVQLIKPDKSRKSVSVVTYSYDGEYISKIEVPVELEFFGTYFSGEKYNFMAFGQENPDEINSREVIRIVKYDKSFQRLGSVSVTGGESYTVMPLLMSPARFAENGNILILHTSRRRYLTAKDGLNHQSNLSVILNSDTMSITYVSSQFPENHVSHSFDQFVLFDGDLPVFLDLGDAYPRSLYLQRGKDLTTIYSSVSTDGSEIRVLKPRPGFESESGVLARDEYVYDRAAMYGPIDGAIGDNYTGVTVGGLELSDTSFITVIATDRMRESIGYARRDIVVCVLPRNFTDGAAAKQITLGKYIDTDTLVSTPKLIKVDNNSYAVVWAEYNTEGDYSSKLIGYTVQYIDGSGQPIGNRKSYDDEADIYAEIWGLSKLYLDGEDHSSVPTPAPPETPAPSETQTPTLPETPAPDAPALSTSDAAISAYIYGDNRVSTSVAISQKGWKSAQSVILAPGGDNNLVDALAAAPLAGQEDAPILLSVDNTIDTAVLAEIQRLGASKIITVGALSDNLIEQLRTIFPNLSIETLRGADRFATASLINAKLTNPQGTVVVGYNAIADAVSIASWAAANRYAIHIANPDGSANPPQYGSGTNNATGGTANYILGGPTLVQNLPGYTRIYGADRYATNLALRQTLSFNNEAIYTADGNTLVDALTGSVLAAKTRSAIVLTPNNDPTGTDFGDITAETKVYGFGGEK